jgi:hypothetical protein
MPHFWRANSVWICLVLVGCSGAPPKADAYPVTGKVSAGGKPLAGYLITFVPSTAGNEASSATTDSNGAYTLATLDGRPGCVPGKYKVVIKPGAEATMAAMKNMKPGMSGPPGATSDVPPSYGDAATSPKEVEVKAEPNTIDITI